MRKKARKNMRLFQAISSALIEFLHLGLVAACFVGKAREGFSPDVSGLEMQKCNEEMRLLWAIDVNRRSQPLSSDGLRVS